MKTSSRTVVLLSATMAFAATGLGQTQQNTATTANYNFYITTPQTGKQVTVGAPTSGATSAATREQSTQQTATATRRQTNSAQQPNVYIPQQQARVPAVASTSARNEASARSAARTSSRQTAQPHQPSQTRGATSGQNFYSGANQGYTIQQVSNPAPSLASANANQSRYTNQRGSVVSTSARQTNTYNQYYQTQQQQNPAYVSNANAASTQRQGFFGRLMHPQQQSQHAQHTQQTTAHNSGSLLSHLKPSKLAGRLQEGMASWYGSDWHGKKTANGERYDMNSMTAAHKSLPFGTMVRVTNERNGRECVVRINNRGPFSKGRIIDLSKAAASSLGMISSGVAKVKCEVIGRS